MRHFRLDQIEKIITQWKQEICPFCNSPLNNQDIYDYGYYVCTKCKDCFKIGGERLLDAEDYLDLIYDAIMEETEK